MRSLIRALVCLLTTLSIGLGAVAHAGETASLCVQELSGAHVDDRDADTGGDGDAQGLHVHGGCHGHHQADAFRSADGAFDIFAGTMAFARPDHFCPQSTADPNLRPPIA
ncbi:MAG: hypothetical protein U0S50_07345 [Sphingopyxis sp.]|uniref:hypothetical protein n=1 Tax=Sphingopyxis sp. TaxID=1908224 RepID=UPI002AB9D397|nr:hypothetical protein [Sphingopyxis sp.]MDZ3831616.1 hypothetical protein [Sphingopyxis sp.]